MIFAGFLFVPGQWITFARDAVLGWLNPSFVFHVKLLPTQDVCTILVTRLLMVSLPTMDRSTNISLAASFRSPSRSPSSSKNSRCCWITRDWLSRKTCKTFSKLNLVYLNPSLWKWLTRADQSLILKSPHYPAKFKNWKKKCQACRLRLLTSGSVDGVIAERTDRERRKNNIILYNLEEFSYLLPSANSS